MRQADQRSRNLLRRSRQVQGRAQGVCVCVHVRAAVHTDFSAASSEDVPLLSAASNQLSSSSNFCSPRRLLSHNSAAVLIVSCIDSAGKVRDRQTDRQGMCARAYVCACTCALKWRGKGKIGRCTKSKTLLLKPSARYFRARPRMWARDPAIVSRNTHTPNTSAQSNPSHTTITATFPPHAHQRKLPKSAADPSDPTALSGAAPSPQARISPSAPAPPRLRPTPQPSARRL